MTWKKRTDMISAADALEVGWLHHVERERRR